LAVKRHIRGILRILVSLFLTMKISEEKKQHFISTEKQTAIKIVKIKS
jgi:hypothetical protein